MGVQTFAVKLQFWRLKKYFQQITTYKADWQEISLHKKPYKFMRILRRLARGGGFEILVFGGKMF